MSNLVREGIYGTFVLIALFLVVMNAGNFVSILKEFTNFYTGSVAALQGRGGATAY